MPDKRKNNGGKRPGAGRKPKADEEELLEILEQAWPKKDVIAAIKAIAERAMMGDLAALTLLLAYKYGKPKEKHELSGPDGSPPVVNLIIETAKPKTPAKTG